MPDKTRSETHYPKSQRTAAVWLATGLGLGFSPIMPGTVGTLWGLPLAWGLATYFPAWGQATITAILVSVGVPLCARAARDLGGKKDPGSIVWDEIASFPIVYWGHAVTPWSLGLGYLLHRVFDISKPPPTRRLERLPGGWGIMADDVMAAVFANFGLWIVRWQGATF